jgi:hypothetical protein
MSYRKTLYSLSLRKRELENALNNIDFTLTETKGFKQVWRKGSFTIIIGKYRVWLFNQGEKEYLGDFRDYDDYQIFRHLFKSHFKVTIRR